MSLDPFSLVYNALWELVERNQKLKELLPAGNRVKFDDENPIKSEVTDADLPELMLLLAGGTPGQYDTRDYKSITRQYVWALETGDYRVNPIYNRITFELWRSMVDFECVLCALTWCNCNFVKDCRMVSVDENRANPEANRLIEGWVGLWACEVDMGFDKNILKIVTPAVGSLVAE